VTLILGLETSCDETAAAIVADGRAARANVVWSQHALHEAYRGVVPEIASRAHLERLQPVVQQALDEADCSLAQIDAIAVGNRPGLIGSLIVGVSAAKAFAWGLDKPLIGVDHVQAHLYAPFVQWPQQDAQADAAPPAASPSAMNDLPFDDAHPALGLVVSGGHTSLYEIQSPTRLHRLGATIDDAVGEAFDKAAAILEAGYPGGPAIEKLAKTGDAKAHDLPMSLLAKDSLDFSFSGLKTALLYTVRGKPRGRGKQATFERSAKDLTDPQRADLAAAFQRAAVEALIVKLNRALDVMAADNRAPHALLVGGGVSANALLRRRLHELMEKRGLTLHLPPMALCVDNAAMIAGLAYHRLQAGDVDDLDLPAMASAQSAVETNTE
jgi:N6-L-threonylcarbamoyladenine synthase